MIPLEICSTQGSKATKRGGLAARPAVEGLEERSLLSAAHDLAVPKHVAVPVPVDKPVSGYQQEDPPGQCRSCPTLFSSGSDKNGPPPPLYSDSNLVDPWDINFPTGRPGIVPPPEVWVADQGTGVATMYEISHGRHRITKSPLTVTIPTVTAPAHGPAQPAWSRIRPMSSRSQGPVVPRSRHLHL